MKNFNLTITLIFIYSIAFGQNKKPLVEIEVNTQSTHRYLKLSIQNNSDSILYLLHSCFLKKKRRLNEFIEYGRDTSFSYYSLRFMNDDKRIDFGIGCFRATAILPYQTLQFNAITSSSKRKNLELLVDYFYANNYEHKKFKKEILRTAWYEKYDWQELRLKLPVVQNVRTKDDFICCDIIMEIYTDSNNIQLAKDDFILMKSQLGFDLKILNETKLEKVKKLIKPVFKICINGELKTAKPLHILSSNVPDDADCFYPISSKEMSVIINKNMIYFNAIKN